MNNSMGAMNAEEVIRIATRIEEKGLEFYEAVAEKIDNPIMERQLKALASWEDTHVAQMKKLMPENAYSEQEYPLFFSPEEDVTQYLNAIADQHIFAKECSISDIVDECKTISDLLKLALRFEKESVEFYTTLAHKIVDDESREIVKTIASEEVEHVETIEKLLDDANSY